MSSNDKWGRGIDGKIVAEQLLEFQLYVSEVDGAAILRVATMGSEGPQALQVVLDQQSVEALQGDLARASTQLSKAKKANAKKH